MAHGHLFLWILANLLIPVYCLRFHIINVGLVSGEESDSRENDAKFWRFNRTFNVLLEPVAVDVYSWSSVHVTRAVCSILERGAHVLVSSPPPRLYPLLRSYSQKFHLPLIRASAPGMDSDSVSLVPGSERAVADLLAEYQWQSLIFIYDDDNGPNQLEKILEFTGNKAKVDAFWRVSSAGEATVLLNRGFSRTNRTGVLLATKQELLNELMSKPPIGLFHFILVDPVVEVENEVESNRIPPTFLITRLTIPGSQLNPDYQQLENRWQTILPHLKRATRSKTVPSSALYMNDIANVLEKAFRNVLTEDPDFSLRPGGVNCLEDKPDFHRDYYNLVDYNIRKVILASGMTGAIKFSADGQRTGFSLNVLEVTAAGVKKVGTWSSKSRLKMNKNESQNGKQVAVSRKKIIVSSVLGNAFLKLRNGGNRTGNEQFEGYIKDLLDDVTNSLDWDYEIRIEEDGAVGEVDESGHWTGMMGKLSRQEAHLAIGPIAASSRLLEVADFSNPFLTVGLTILLKKPDDLHYRFSGIGPVGMLRVWSYDVWLVLAVCYLVAGAAAYAVARFTGDPDRIRSLATKMSDRLSPCSSFWFVLGILTFRGTGIFPKSSTFRLLSIVWGFFSLMVFLFYISCLSSQLLRDRGISDTVLYPRKTHEFLKNFIDNGYPKVGIWKEEPLLEFVEKGVFKDYKDLLDNDGSLVVDSYEAGVDMVRHSDGGFAFIVNSAYGQYISGRQPCDTMITTGYLTEEPYVVAFQKGSELREQVDRELLRLFGRGELRRLYEKWWYHNASCVDPYLNVVPRVYSSSLTLTEVSGVFYFLIISICIVEAIAMAECFFWRKKKPPSDS